jgi:TP901 family phage tail tape measure protein
MADNEYKISLGVQVETDDIKTQLSGVKVDPIKINIDLNHTKKQIDAIKSQIQSLNNIKINLGAGTGSGSRNGVRNTVSEMNWAYKQMLDIQKKANSLSIKINGLDTSKNVNELKELSLQFARLRSDYETLRKTFGTSLSTAQWGTLQAELDETTAKLSAMDAKIADTRAKFAKDIKIKLADGSFKNDISNIESKFSKLSDKSDNLQSDIEDVRQAITNMSNASKTGNIDKLIANYENYERALKKVNNQLQINARNERDAAIAQKLTDDRSAFQSKIDAWLTKNSAATKKFGAQMLDLKAKAQSCDRVTLDHLQKEFKQLDQEAEAAGLKMQTLGDRIKTQFQRYSSYLSVASIFMYTTQALRDMFEQVVAIDSAMTELKKVTDETDASYNQFLGNAASRAKEIGTTVEGLVASTADFARLGYGFEDSQGLAEVANIYAVVGDEVEGVEGATESLISTMAAFKNEMNGLSNTDFAMSIIDKFNEIGNKFAISSGGIGESLKRSASSLDAANNSIDESIALITAANTVVQDPDRVGNAFKTISMRIRGAKTELEEAGESTEGMAESTAKMRQEVMALSGVDIMLNESTFKSTYQIMDELSTKWEDLSDIAQASIIELMAGKHQGNVFSSLMTNFDIAREALEVSANSAGSAMQEHAKWSESLEARLLKLQAAWQSLSQSFMSSNFLKIALDGIIGLVDGITKLIDTFGTIPTLITGFSIFRSAFSNKGIFRTFNNDLDGFANKVGIANKSFTELLGAFKSANSGGFKGFFNGLKSIGDAIVNPLSKTDLSAIDAYNKLIDSGVDSQKAFAQTMNNTSIAAQDLVKSANGSKVALNAVKTSSIGGKVALLGMRAAALLMNAALTMGISLLIDFAVSGIMKIVNAEKDLSEEVSEITSKFKEQHNELKKLQGDYDTSNESSMIAKYEKLSKGVDSLGRNISLTTEEYSEYQNIVNTIASQIPSLVSGYDSQGNALLSCKDNVDKLTEAYEKLIHAQNQEILTNTGNIEKDFKNTLKDAEKGSFLGMGKKVSTPSIELLEKTLNGNYSVEEIEKLLKDLSTGQEDGVYEALYNAGIGDMGRVYNTKEVAETLAKQLKTDKSKIKGIIDNYYTQFADAVEEQKTIAQAVLSEAFDVSSAISGLNYGNIGEELQGVASQVISSLDFDFFAKLSESGDSVEQWTKEMLNQLSSISKADNAKIEAAFDLNTQFNGGKISYGEYVKGLEDVGSRIEDLNLKDELETQLKITLGLNDDGLVDGYKVLKNKLANSEKFNISNKEYTNFLDGLSSEEVSVAIDVITELESTSYKEDISDIKAAIEKEMMLQGLTFDLDLEVESAGIESLNTALAESVTGSGLSAESIAALKARYADLEEQGYDVSAIFENTSHGIHLNREEFSKFEKELSSQKIAEIDGDLKEMKNTYDKLGEQIRACDDPIRKSELFSERQLLGRKIAEAAELATQYKGLTSAYNDWLAAEEAGSERDMYENMIKGFETVGDEISRGWLDDGTIKFLELIKGEKATIIDGNGVKKEVNIATASTQELKKVWKDLDKNIKHTTHSVRDFFTVDEDGNSTSQGVYNFLDAIGQMEEEKFLDENGKPIDVVKRKDGKIIGFDFQLVGGDKAIAEALGISEELVQIMKRAAEDAGFVVSLDGTYKEYAILANEAEAASNKLKELSKNNEKLKKAGGDFKFDFDTTNIKTLEEDLKQANNILNTFKDKDENINLKADGAIEAMQIVSTLQARLDDLKSEQYGIGLTVEDEEFEEPLENLQEYGRTVAELNQLRINPNVNSERIEQLEGELDNIAEEFNNLPDKKKIELGLVGEDGKTPLNNIEDIQKKIESGEVKIPTVLDIQANMDKNLEDLKKIALLGSGLLSDEQEEKIKLEILADIEVKADEVDDSDVEKTVNEAANGDGGKTHDGSSGKKHGGSNGSIEVKTDVEIKTGDVDDSDVKDNIEKTVNGRNQGLSGEKPKVEQKVEIDLIAERADDLELTELIKDCAPIKQKVIVEYFAEHSDVDKYTPEQKEALVDFIANTDNLDSYTPEEKEAIVQYLTDSADPDNWTPEQKEAVARFIRESGDVDSYTPEKKEAIAKFIKDSIEPDSYIPPSPDSTVTFLKDSSDVDTYDPPSFTRYVTYYAKKAFTTGAKAGEKALENRFGIGGVNGTANSSGSAFRQGDWRTKRSETALTGELGREIVVTPQNRWYTVGDNGAEFVNIPRGSIVFNHKQTEELLRNGKATSDGGRARALVNGTALLGGTAHRGEGEWIGSEYESQNAGNESSDKFEDVIDWIEIILDRVERSIDKFDQQTNNIYKNWSYRNKALANEISEIGREINLQEQAKNAYLAKANSVGLPESYASKVRNGSISVEDFTGKSDEKLVEKIEKYRTYYEAALDCEDAIRELREEESKLYKQRFDNVATQYEGALSIIEHEKNMLEEYISQSEAQSWLVSSKYYDALASNERENISKLKEEKNALLSSFETAMNSGTIDKYSEAWYDMVAAVDEVTLAITEGETALKEYAQAIQEIKFEQFDLLQDRISSVTEETEFLIELLSSDKLYDDRGQLTNEGKATMGLHGTAYNTYMYQADQVAKETERLKKELAKDPYDTDLEARYREMIALQQEYILNAQDQKEAIRDMVEEGIEYELDALSELIDKYNESLDSQKDLYDYQKRVQEQTKEIASLEKQMAAYAGDNSEEAKAKIQELKVSLEEAKSDLEETEYDKYISDTQKILDDLYLEYETILNERLDNLDGLISDMILEINSDAGIISDTINASADSVGYTLTESMNTIWSGANNVITTYGERFSQAQTTTNTALNTINTNLQNMINQLNSIANKNVQSASTSSAAHSSQANASPAPSTPSTTTSSAPTQADYTGVALSIINGNHDWGTGKEREQKLKEAGLNPSEVQSMVNELWNDKSVHNGSWQNKYNVGDLSQYSYKNYKTGAFNIGKDQLAWTQEGGKREFIIRPSDGAILTPLAKSDSVLNAFASDNIWKMANSPAEFIKDNLNFGVTNIPNNSNVNNTYSQNLENVVFNFPNVRNYSELLSEMQRDPKFEKLILSMTIDQVAGKSYLAKGKSIR